MLSVLKNPVYRKLFTAQVVALLGTGLLTIALGLLAFDLAGSKAGAVLGTALTIKMLAYVGVAPVIAALVERLPRKVVLVAADIVRAAVALSLPFLTEVWQIYVLVFVLQAASATFTPAFQSVIPVILPDEKAYTRALSLSRLAYDLEALVSPALAALLLTVVSYNNLFLGTTAGFLVSALMVVTIALPTGEQAAAVGSVWHRTTLGVRIFARTPSLRSLMVLNLTVGASTALVLVNSVVYARDTFGLSNSSLALALASYGAGSMIVALNVPRILDRTGDRTLMLTGASILTVGLLLAIPMTVAAGAWAGSWWFLLALWALMGAGNAMIITPSARILRRASTDQTRSYIFTAQFSLSHAAFLITYPIAGWLGALGLVWAVVALAIIAAGSMIAARVMWPAPQLAPEPVATMTGA
ncbi:MFS transporter [Cryobacterium fucosi]|uniref:MFS transporter n=1 Tax=Cryobacterium fucosi TaxID=1259157 RepID=A0A4R9B8R3_9MICO|nr:MFS transporter [Cryobacterium fucosi]TFD78200.1 MFS transporter [Cryobacterium fucosi]